LNSNSGISGVSSEIVGVGVGSEVEIEPSFLPCENSVLGWSKSSILKSI